MYGHLLTSRLPRLTNSTDMLTSKVTVSNKKTKNKTWFKVFLLTFLQLIRRTHQRTSHQDWLVTCWYQWWSCMWHSSVAYKVAKPVKEVGKQWSQPLLVHLQTIPQTWSMCITQPIITPTTKYYYKQRKNLHFPNLITHHHYQNML